MQINPLIGNDRGQRIQNTPIKNADILETFVLLAIYKSLSNRSSSMLLCHFAPFTHTVTVILFRYLYEHIGNKWFLKTASHSTNRINHGTPFFRKQTQDLSHSYSFFSSDFELVVRPATKKSLDIQGMGRSLILFPSRQDLWPQGINGTPSKHTLCTSLYGLI